MKLYLISLTLFFSLALAIIWKWGLDHRLTYLSRDYAILTGKEKLLDDYAGPGLVIFGDSTVMDDVRPELLGPGVVNCGMSGSTPIESYFLVRRLLKSSMKPGAVLLSYNAFHFVHPDFYWENSVKFGLVGGSDADEVTDQIFKLNDKELITGSSIGHLEQKLYSFLFSRGFPPYYVSSFFAEKYGVREKQNEEALKAIAKTRGQYYFPQTNGSKSLNKDTELKAFTVSPVVDLYFRKTLDLLKAANVPTYFCVMPTNESSVSHLDPTVMKAYEEYLLGLTGVYPQFHILGQFQTVYPWTLFSDYAHLNARGTERFNRDFAHLLNKEKVPGGPYGRAKH